jgi:GntR family transcriptional regulator
MARAKWSEIYDILKDRIYTGHYQAGQNFPTNLELIKEFNAHTMTVQSAVNALIREGLVISSSTRNPRRVRALPEKLTSFHFNHASSEQKTATISLRTIDDLTELPTDVSKEMKLPVFFCHYETWLNNTLAAVTRSYFSNDIDFIRLQKKLQETNGNITNAIDDTHLQPIWYEETLHASFPTEKNKKDLHLPINANVIIIHLLRKGYDDANRICEISFITSRADCFEFHYRFPVKK